MVEYLTEMGDSQLLIFCTDKSDGLALIQAFCYSIFPPVNCNSESEVLRVQQLLCEDVGKFISLYLSSFLM